MQSVQYATRIAACFVVLAACATPTPIPRTSRAASAPSVSGAAVAAAAPGRHARRPLGSVPLPRPIAIVAGARAAFAISHVAGERIAWVRRIEEANGAFGPLLAFEGENVVGAFDVGDDTSIATSDGRRICVAYFRGHAHVPEKRGCAEIAPSIVARLGDRLALVELEIAPPAPKRRAHVDVGVRCASFAGDFDASTTRTGLSFDRPLLGMTIVDAASRAGALDLLWYEPAPKRTRSRLGSARLGVGTIGADGAFDTKSRRALYDAELEYGGLAGRRGARLVARDGVTALVSSAARGALCEAVQVEPTLGAAASAPVACAIDPAGLAAGTSDETKLAPILALDPRRAPGQSKSDGPLVAWSTDRAWFVEPDGALASYALGRVRTEGAPMAATAASVAWSAIARDGEGIALAAEKLWRLDPSGEASALSEALIARLDEGGRAAVRARGNERRRAARIGDAWFVAHGDVARVAPEPLAVAALAGRAHPGATALVGGASRGTFLEIAGGVLRVTAVRPNGAIEVLEEGAPSPIAARFDAVERRRGGAIVAGAAGGASSASKLVAFFVDADGRMSAPSPTSIAGADARLIALPRGGALLTDAARTRVAWLDDDAREIAAAAWPDESARATCAEGEPARVMMPTPTPGAFARVAELVAEGTCVVGDATWSADGTLRWFGAQVRGLDATAEAGVVPVAVPPPAPHARRRVEAAPRSFVASIIATVAPLVPACPADMVSIAGRYCVDRYEATLVDAASGEPFSPDYPATPSFFDVALADWATGRARWGNAHARAFPLPLVPRPPTVTPLALSRRGARPNGYVQGVVAEAACVAAGKRLCTRDEIRTACRGEDDTAFPYGPNYVEGACNVFRDDHPAAILHDNASLGHLDPRLDRVAGADGPLLRPAGATPQCRSRWGADAVYDLVGNLDEWIDDPKGAFAGGFFSRATRAGCDAVITAHPKVYLDYSTGVRCCKDAR